MPQLRITGSTARGVSAWSLGRGKEARPEPGVDMGSAGGTHKGSIVAGHWNRGLDACGSKLQPDLVR